MKRLAQTLWSCGWTGAVLAVSGLTGCEPKGSPQIVPPPTVESPAPPPAWAPQPVSMRIYPTTRFVNHENRSMLEAHVELIDEMGDTAKASGTFRLELLDQQRSAESPIGKKLYSWEVPVMTLEHQRHHYDRISRTYHFLLILDEQLPASRKIMLRVTLLVPNGPTVATESILSPPGRDH